MKVLFKLSTMKYSFQIVFSQRKPLFSYLLILTIHRGVYSNVKQKKVNHSYTKTSISYGNKKSITIKNCKLKNERLFA